MHSTETESDAVDDTADALLLYKVPQVATKLGVKERFVWQLIGSGELPSFIHAKRRVVAATALDAYVAEMAAERDSLLKSLP